MKEWERNGDRFPERQPVKAVSVTLTACLEQDSVPAYDQPGEWALPAKHALQITQRDVRQSHARTPFFIFLANARKASSTPRPVFALVHHRSSSLDASSSRILCAVASSTRSSLFTARMQGTRPRASS